jgi:DNA-binding response OmpR family regulator
VTVHVRRLREKVEADPKDPRLLVTVWGVGYRFDLPAEQPTDR